MKNERGYPIASNTTELTDGLAMRHEMTGRQETLRRTKLLRDTADQLRQVADDMRRNDLDAEADTLTTTIRDLAWQCEMLLNKEFAASPADGRRRSLRAQLRATS